MHHNAAYWLWPVGLLTGHAVAWVEMSPLSILVGFSLLLLVASSIARVLVGRSRGLTIRLLGGMSFGFWFALGVSSGTRNAWLGSLSIAQIAVSAAAASFLLLAVVVVVAWIASGIRGRRRQPVDAYPRCGWCHYSLRGLDDDRCPECGAIRGTLPVRRRITKSISRHGRLAGIVVGVTTLTVGILEWSIQRRDIELFRRTFKIPEGQFTLAPMLGNNAEPIRNTEATIVSIDDDTGLAVLVLVSPGGVTRVPQVQIRLVWGITVPDSGTVMPMDGIPPVMCNVSGSNAMRAIRDGVPDSLVSLLRTTAIQSGWLDRPPTWASTTDGVRGLLSVPSDGMPVIVEMAW